MATTQLLIGSGYQAHFCKIVTPFVESDPSPVYIPPAQYHTIKTKDY